MLAAADAHLRGCADCQRVAPELDVLRARLGDPAVWETPAPELRSHVVVSGGLRRPSHANVSRRSGAALVDGRRGGRVGDRRRRRVARRDQPTGPTAPTGSWRCTPTRSRPARWSRSKVGTPTPALTCGSTSTGSHPPVRTSTTRSGCRRSPASTCRQGRSAESGRIEAWSGVSRADFPRDLDHARARRRRRAAHRCDGRRHARMVIRTVLRRSPTIVRAVANQLGVGSVVLRVSCPRQKRYPR